MLIARAVMLVFSVVGAATSCASYTSGAMAREYRAPKHEVRESACVDIALDLRADVDARNRSGVSSDLVLGVRMGNHCNEPAPIDLSRMVVRGESGGRPFPNPIGLYDPRHEVRALAIDMHAEGYERLLLVAGPGYVSIDKICVDLSPVVPSEPDAKGLRPEACFTRDAGLPALWVAQ